jgi:hypothetical protein
MRCGVEIDIYRTCSLSVLKMTFANPAAIMKGKLINSIE